ncbi:MAG: hypothetical protein Kow001_06740 [Acidobacteriota bacterium]
MVELRLDQEEAAILRQVLDSYLSDLRMEVANTDLLEFRERLKHEESVLKELLRRLSVPEPVES